MRISRYAFLIEDQNDYYAYSTLSNSLLNIDKEAFIFLKGIQNGNMDCCFNCHYCFEKVKGGDTMSESVMDSIVKYVSVHKELKSLRVTWFGGEPL